MQSRGLFDFFTKAADIRQTAAGTRIASGQSAQAMRQQTSTDADKAYTAEQKHSAGTPAQGQQQPTPQVTQSAQQSTYNRQPSSAQARATVRTADQFGRPTTLVKRRKGERVQSPVFKGGYAVNVDPGLIDWSERGDGSINVRGTRLTQEQYDMYNNIRSQLAGYIAMQGGVDPQTARDQAGMLAAQYIGDQMNIANGGKAFNSWQHAEKQQAPQVTQTTPQPESPQASGGSINSTAALGEPAAAQPTAQQLESITSSAPVNTTDNLPLTLGGVPSFTTSEAPLTFSPPQPEPQPQPAPQPEPQPQPAPQPVTWDLEAGSKDPMGYIKHYTQALDADTIGRWNLKGKEREGWATQDGKLSAKGYFKGMAGRHYNNMQNLYKFVTDASLSDKDRYEVMKALNQEARRYDYYKEQSDLYRYPTAYDAKLHGPDSVRASIMEKQLAKGPVTFGWLYKNLAQDLKDYSDNYFSNNYYVKSIQ